MTQQCGSENRVEQLETHWKWFNFFSELVFFFVLANISIQKKNTGQLHRDIECAPLVNNSIYSGH